MGEGEGRVSGKGGKRWRGKGVRKEIEKIKGNTEGQVEIMRPQKGAEF